MKYRKLLNKIKKEILFSFIVFFVFVFLGVWYCASYPAEADLFFEEIQEEFSFLTRMSFSGTFLFIFLNNTLKVFLGMLLGIVFGIIPFLFLAINGFVIGLVAAYVYPSFGTFGLIVSLLPHGIFELSALFIGSGYGFYLGLTTYIVFKNSDLKISSFYKDLRRLKFPKIIKTSLQEAFDSFILIVLPLLLVAAIIETVLIFFL